MKPGDHIVAVNGERALPQMMKYLKENDNLEIELTHPVEFRVNVQKGDALGIDYTHAPSGDCLLIRKVLDSGSLGRWNESHRASSVNPLDRIIEVNCHRGSWSKILAEIQRAQDLSLVIAPCPVPPPEPAG